MALDVKKILDDYKKIKASGGGVNRDDFFQLKSGPDGNKMRLVPFKDSEGNDKLYVASATHFLGQGQGTVTCLRISGEPCPICEYQAQAKARKLKVVADQLFARKRFYYNVVVHGQGGKPELKVLEVGKNTHEEILSYFANEDYGDISDLRTGRDLKITKTGSGLKTEYDVKVRPDRTPCPKFEGTPKDLTQFAVTISRDEAEAMLYGVFERFEEEEGADSGPSEFNPDAESDSVVEVAEARPNAQQADDGWADEQFGPAVAVPSRKPEPQKPAAAKPQKPPAPKPQAPGKKK